VQSGATAVVEMRHLIAPSSMPEAKPTLIHSSSQKGMHAHQPKAEPQPPRCTILLKVSWASSAMDRDYF
jgi:hypothetical protein